MSTLVASTIRTTTLEETTSAATVSVSNLITINDQRINGYGLVPSNNSADSTNDIDFTAGKCWDTTRTNYITVAAMTKRADAPWAAGTGEGMMDTGAFAANSCYYFWAIYKDSDGTGDIIMSLADTWVGVNKSLITGYTTGQLIHAMPSSTNSSSWRTVTIVGPLVDYAISSVEVSSYTAMVNNVTTAFTVNVPKLALGRFAMSGLVSTPNYQIILGLCDAYRAGQGFDHYDGMVYLNQLAVWQTAINGEVLIDASQQIGAIMYWLLGNDTVNIWCKGYTFHRRFAGT